MRNNTPPADMPLTDNDGEVRELTAADMSSFKSIDEVLPELAAVLPKRGKQKAPTKQRVTIRLDREVVSHFKADGKGWQGRINDTLAAHVPS